jgi:hypothetical protein
MKFALPLLKVVSSKNGERKRAESFEEDFEL